MIIISIAAGITGELALSASHVVTYSPQDICSQGLFCPHAVNEEPALREQWIPLGEQIQDVLQDPWAGMPPAGFPEQVIFERGLKG